MSDKIAACVVLYNPDFDVLSNISSYYKAVNYFVVIDNSETLNIALKEKLCSSFPGVIYMFLNRNTGIASALNVACTMAIEVGCKWILTMDQDSSFLQQEVLLMIKGIPGAKQTCQNIGIISPFHVLHKHSFIEAASRYSVKNIVMTSGNLLNLEAYTITGAFEEKLFMDYVDYEYCLRLRKNRYKIIQDNHVHLKHSLGDFKIKKIFSQKIGVSNHSALRRYYMTRNSLYVGFKYLRAEKKFFLNMLKNILFWDPFIILTYEKDKLTKLKSIYKGIFHFISNRYGKAI